MCGIAGVIWKNGTQADRAEAAAQLLAAIAHRGPDGTGCHETADGVFVHTRLAIVDIAGGAQPIFSADRRCGIVFNGEIYNYLELRRALEARDYRFTTNSDTEVILKAYEEYGVEVFGKLNGMFALAIWDEREKRVVLARDRFGIKPLYLYEDETRIVFASEMKGITALPGLDLTPDPAGINDYMTFRYVQAPYTVFKRVRRVEPRKPRMTDDPKVVGFAD